MRHNLELQFINSDLVVAVRDFRVEEAMNRPFEVHLTAVSQESLDIATLIGEPACFAARFGPTVTFLGQGLDAVVRAGYERLDALEGRLSELPFCGDVTDVAREALEAELASLRSEVTSQLPVADWSGIVVDVEETGTESPLRFLYRVRLVHPLWVLSQNRNYRIYQHHSELDIARAIIDEWGIDENLLADPSQYKKRDFRIQYGESELDFFHRNLEDVGVSYFLEDSDDGEVVTFCAHPEKTPAREGGLAYFEEPPPDARREWAARVAVRRTLRPGKYTLQDVDYRIPPGRQPRISQRFADEKQGDPAAHFVSALERALETFEYNPGAFAVEGQGGGDSPVGDRKQVTRTDTKYGEWLTGVRLRSMNTNRYRIHFETNAFDLHPGAVVTIDDHPRPELADPVLVLATTFTGDEAGAWKMECVGHPTKLPYVPELVAPRPRSNGVETATVVGVPGKKADGQEVGSVLVQFHWDREGKHDDNSSCWVPVSYGLAGPGRGMFALPRVGEEVLVDFLFGDLDKPMVTGRVYTGLNKPWNTDVNTMGNLNIKNDSLDSPAQHTFINMTADAKPLMHLHSSHDTEHSTGNDRRSKVNRNCDTKIGGYQTVNITGTASTTSGGTMTLRAGDKEAADLTASALTNVTLSADEGDVGIFAATKDVNIAAVEVFRQYGKMVKIEAEERIVLAVGPTKLVLAPGMAVLEAEQTFINPGPDAADAAAFAGVKPMTAAEEADETERTWQDVKTGKNGPADLEQRKARREKARRAAIDKEMWKRWPADKRNPEVAPDVGRTLQDLERRFPPNTSPYWDSCPIYGTPLY